MSSSSYTIESQDIQSLNARLLYISLSKYEKDWQSIPHTHHFVELIYILNGKGDFYIDKTRFPIDMDNLIIIPPNIEHTEKSCPSAPLEYIVLGLDGITFQNCCSSHGRLIHNYKNYPDILTLLQLLLKEADEKKEGCHLVCHNLLEALLIQILRIQRLAPTPLTTAKITKECYMVKRYLDSHLAEPITLDKLAGLAHMSKYYLVHAFTKYTGYSPISYLTLKRIHTSKELLKNTDYSISEIASSVGFSSQSYFSQVFKKEENCTPAQYRKHAK